MKGGLVNKVPFCSGIRIEYQKSYKIKVLRRENGKEKMDTRSELGSSNCICERPKTKIMCTNCDYVSFGRVRQTCNIHPYVTYLMDLTKCPKCNRNCYESGEPRFNLNPLQVVSPSVWKF